MSQIAIIEDDIGLRRGVADCLEDLGHEVRCFASVEEVRPSISHWIPDVLVLDLNLPGEGGLSFLRSIREKGPWMELPVLVVSGRTYARDRIQGLEAGADDYLSKPFDPDELCARVDCLKKRAYNRSVAPIDGDGVVQTKDMMLNVRERRIWNGIRWFSLTPMEFRLLATFLRYPGRVLSVDDLLRMVWEFPSGTGNPSLVRWAVNQLRSKVEVEPSRPKRLITRPRKGYFFAGEGIATSGDGAVSAFSEPPELTSSLVAQAPVGIAALDHKGRFILWNDRAGRVLGYSKEEILGVPMQRKIHPDSSQDVLKSVAAIAETGYVAESCFDVGLLHKDGYRVNLRVLLHPFVLSGTNYVAVVFQSPEEPSGLFQHQWR